MVFKNKSKRGISPVIATVMLIALVIVLALLVFLWARSFIGESLQKDGQSEDQACDNVELSVSYSGNEVEITNDGNVPVYQFNVVGESGDSESVEEFEESIRLGDTLVASVSSYDSVEVVPIILGETDEGKEKTYICEENTFSA